MWSDIAIAQPTIVPQRAPNGIMLDLGTDAFANRKAVSSPILGFQAQPDGAGKFQVEELIDKGQPQELRVHGYIIYGGDGWRHFSSAIYQGGDAARFKQTGSEVITCKPTRLSPDGCSFSEDFEVATSPEEVAAHNNSGTVAIRVTGAGSAMFTLEIPASYFEAVDQVGKEQAGPQ